MQCVFPCFNGRTAGFKRGCLISNRKACPFYVGEKGRFLFPEAFLREEMMLCRVFSLVIFPRKGEYLLGHPKREELPGRVCC